MRFWNYSCLLNGCLGKTILCGPYRSAYSTPSRLQVICRVHNNITCLNEFFTSAKFSPHPPVSEIYGTGIKTIAAFLDGWGLGFLLFVRSWLCPCPVHFQYGYFLYQCSIPGSHFLLCPPDSVYVVLEFQPVIHRLRLSPSPWTVTYPGRSTLLWSLRYSAGSHLLATHSAFSSINVHRTPYGQWLHPLQYDILYQCILLLHSQLRCRVCLDISAQNKISRLSRLCTLFQCLGCF